MFEIINEKKYIYWELNCYIQEMKLLQEDRTNLLMQQIRDVKNISDNEIYRQCQERNGFAYDIFIDFNKIGGNDFYQEIYTCLPMIDFLGKDKVEGIAFPVKNNCPEDISLISLKDYLENDAEYDFLLKKQNVFLKFQLKSVPEKHTGKFNKNYFIENIKHLTTERYNDTEMIILYLFQPSLERNSMKDLSDMADSICQDIGRELPVKNIYFLGRKDLQKYFCIQIYKTINYQEFNYTDTLIYSIRK